MKQTFLLGVLHCQFMLLCVLHPSLGYYFYILRLIICSKRTTERQSDYDFDWHVDQWFSLLKYDL